MSTACQYPSDVAPTETISILHRNYTQWGAEYYGRSSVLSVCLINGRLSASIDYYDYQIADMVPLLLPVPHNTELAKHLAPYQVAGSEEICYYARYLLYHTVYMDNQAIDDVWASAVKQLAKEIRLPGWRSI